MPSETSRKSVRFDDDTASRSGSSRSSASRSDSGHESLYEQQALREALEDSENKAADLKAKAVDIERQLTKKLRQQEARFEEERKKLRDANKALEARVVALENENEDLRSNYERLQKKSRDHEAQPATTTSPKSSKPQRSESKRAKDSDADRQKDRLKGRFERAETSSDASSSRRSNSKAPRSRRMSHASYLTDRPYVEPLGPAAARPTVTIPTSPGAPSPPGRRFEGPVAVSKTGQPLVSQYQDPAFSSTPRSAGLERPSVFYKYPNDQLLSPTLGYETGNYYPHPL